MLPLRYSPEVADALKTGKPVVALESTIISHGMPYPDNVRCAREVEAIVRSNGATPATIGIIKGQVSVGMTDEELEAFGQMDCAKVSRRDLATIVGLGRDGATTVAATMMVAHMAGIKLFVTGGIGGVHRGAEETWDVSADLTELGRTPVAVVCAGAKSILDIPKTLEYLETQGVVVIGLRAKEFPAFFTPSSGLPVPTFCETEREVAAIVDAQHRLGLSSGLVVGNPIPSALAAEVAVVEKATEQAVREAAEQNVAGREATPFLLKRINELTGGESLRANIELIKHNALVGAKIAASLAPSTAAAASNYSGGEDTATAALPESAKLAIIGGAVLDFTAKHAGDKRFGEFGTSGTSVPGTMRTSVGGVGRTVAESVSRLAKGDWMFESVLGDDAMGNQVASSCRGFPALLHRLKGQRTATYTAMLDGTGELITAVADMAVFDAWPAVSSSALKSKLLLMDTNVPASTIEQASQTAAELWVEPVSIFKSARLNGCLGRIALASPNIDELRALVESAGAKWAPVDTGSAEGLEATLPAAVEPLLSRGMKHVLVTCGALGAVLCSASPLSTSSSSQAFAFADAEFSVVRRQWQPPAPFSQRGFLAYSVPRLQSVESVTGAGDSLIAGTAWAYALANVPLADAVLYGLAAARLCLASAENVSPLLSQERITPRPAPLASRL
eukprot:TRINITY_DN32472_c0_g1_i1.p1 TRINITY_DN32472_c0_g1~~TRINITY_DN32472_c0_g1_i1.p1  ORF type:complete len:677 (+),score=162.31 TRINITY_DN32472_c0_g1_i1:74-2104(+)